MLIYNRLVVIFLDAIDKNILYRLMHINYQHRCRFAINPQ